MEVKEGTEYCFRHSGCLKTDHTKSINSFFLISDYLVATASEDMDIKIWKIRKNEKVATLIGHKNRITSISVCFNNDYLLE